MKYFNVMSDYHSFLRKAAEEKLWIHQQKIWWGPYDWAFRYGVTWMMNDFETNMNDPYGLLRQGREIIDKNPSEALERRYQNFLAQVEAYYAADKDAKLLKSMETGKWVY